MDWQGSESVLATSGPQSESGLGSVEEGMRVAGWVPVWSRGVNEARLAGKPAAVPISSAGAALATHTAAQGRKYGGRSGPIWLCETEQNCSGSERSRVRGTKGAFCFRTLRRAS
jgi:hypothetical protein